MNRTSSARPVVMAPNKPAAMAVVMIALGLMLLGAPGGAAAVAAENAKSEDCRLIINWDKQSMWWTTLCDAQHGRKQAPDPEKVNSPLK